MSIRGIGIDIRELDNLMTIASDLLALRTSPLPQSHVLTSRIQASIRTRASACGAGGTSTYNCVSSAHRLCFMSCRTSFPLSFSLLKIQSEVMFSEDVMPFCNVFFNVFFFLAICHQLLLHWTERHYWIIVFNRQTVGSVEHIQMCHHMSSTKTSNFVPVKCRKKKN